MNVGVSNSSASSGQFEPPNLRTARFEDYLQISKLEASHGMRTQSEADWRAMWEKNPLWGRLGKDWPIGWVLEDAADGIVGSIVNVPSVYRLGGRELVCANGRAWVCANEYRGFAVLLMDEYFNQENADLFVNTTVGPVATETLEQYATHVPLGDWNLIAFWITGYRGFAWAALAKKRVPLAGLLAFPAAAVLKAKDVITAKSLPASDGSVIIETVDRFDSRFDSFWGELARLNPQKLLAARDSAALAWHYAIPMREKGLWIYTARRGGSLRAYCIVKRERSETGLRRMRIVDFQSIETDRDLLPGFLEAARRRCVAEGVHMLEHLGVGLPKMRAIDEYAPYRRPQGHWPFYFQARDAKLQAELENPAVWDPSSYDGDSSFE